MLSYGGVTLHVPPGDSLQRLTTFLRQIPPSEVYEFESLQNRPFSLSHIDYRPIAPARPIEIGCLHWPIGASRWGVGHFLVTDSDLAEIRPLVYGDAGDEYNALALVMQDGRDAGNFPGIATDLFMLPPRPLAQWASHIAPYETNLNLLTLVDARFYWWERSANITVTGGTTTWAQLYASIATGLGETITADAIPAAYLKPPTDFTANNQALPLLLDAVAFSVQQRIVRALDGTVTAQNWDTAKTSQDDQAALYATKLAGGTFALEV